ncbi:MAG: hypothetical protein AABW51_01695 [Nanoarchaeota archaeon]
MGETYSQSQQSVYDKISPLVANFEVEIKRDEKTEKVKLYDHDVLVGRLRGLPRYVANEVYKSMSDPTIDRNYNKIVLDKWGRKSPETKRFGETPEVIFYRVALNVAQGLKQNDPSVNLDQTTQEVFYKMINKEVFPNTPYMANGGHTLISSQIEKSLEGQNVSQRITNDLGLEKRIREQLFACFVLPMYDSRDSIFKTLKMAADIQAEVGGTGFNFELRPANEAVHSTGGITDGPISFMKMVGQVLGKTMNQGGKRDGANMFMLDWNHPDIMRFLYSKRQDGEISAANISVAIDHDFVEAAKNDGEGRFYKLRNTHYNPSRRPHIKEFYTGDQLKQAIDITKTNKKQIASLEIGENGVDVLSPWVPEGLDESDRIIGKVGENNFVYLDAKKVLRHLAFGAWFNGEPGAIFTGHINDHNPTHPDHYAKYLIEQADEEAKTTVDKLRTKSPDAPLEELVREHVWERDYEGKLANVPIGVGVIRATNPCGEKPLLPYEACVLGHINLEKILVKDQNAPSGYLVDEQKFAKDINLMYEILDNAIDQNEFTAPEIEQTQKSNRKIGLGFMGLANMLYRLEIPYDSKEGRDFVDELLTFWEKESDEASFRKAEKFGAFPNFKYSHHRHGRPKRNAIVRTLAPTGTTGTVAQTTGGMEPEYALAYERTTVQGTKIDIFNSVLNEKLEKYPFFFKEDNKDKLHRFIDSAQSVALSGGSLQGYEITRQGGESEDSFKSRQRNLGRIKKIFVTSYDIIPEDHLKMEAVVQRHVDDAISKTTNFRHNATLEDVERAFLLAHELGIKGVTFYRDGTRKDQPLKVKGVNYDGDKGKSLEDKVEIIRREPIKVPPVMPAVKIRQETPYGNIHMEVIVDPHRNFAPVEVFAQLGNSGKEETATMEGFGRLTSLFLRNHLPADEIIAQLKDIGSGVALATRGGAVESLPMGFARAIMKFNAMKELFGIRSILLGEIDYDHADREASDYLRKGKDNYETRRLPEEIEHLNLDKNKPQETNGNKKRAYSEKCPTPNCSGRLIHEEGCVKCSGCTYNKC